MCLESESQNHALISIFRTEKSKKAGQVILYHTEIIKDSINMEYISQGNWSVWIETEVHIVDCTLTFINNHILLEWANTAPYYKYSYCIIYVHMVFLWLYIFIWIVSSLRIVNMSHVPFICYDSFFKFVTIGWVMNE